MGLIAEAVKLHHSEKSQFDLAVTAGGVGNNRTKPSQTHVYFLLISSMLRRAVAEVKLSLLPMTLL